MESIDDSVRSPSKRFKGQNPDNLRINNLYIKHESKLSEAFCNGETMKLENGAEVITDPFTCCVLPKFVQPFHCYLRELQIELTKLDMQEKKTDLYQFKQSKDLGDCVLPCISKFKILLKDVLEWMKKITKIPLTEKIDLACSSYTFTDHLLCHDDELEDRRIAFIYYLVPEWSEEDGGLLDLFNTVDGQPSEICKSIVPKWNNFVFFEVSPVSYHQVSEVLASETRMALSGWFHGPPLKPTIPVGELLLFKEPTEQGINMKEWINPTYLSGKTKLEICTRFTEDSEISLPDFLKEEKYKEVCEALINSRIKWDKKGPPNQRIVYEANNDKNIPLILKECQALFNSEAFFLLLSGFSALTLHPKCGEGATFGKVISCIRKWCPGSYSLLCDQSFSKMASLNAFMYFNCSEWNPEYGGFSSFVALGESEELLRVEPTANSLALVYVTEETSHFVKYINSRTKEAFYDIYCMYIEDEENNSKE